MIISSWYVCCIKSDFNRSLPGVRNLPSSEGEPSNFMTILKSKINCFRSLPGNPIHCLLNRKSLQSIQFDLNDSTFLSIMERNHLKCLLCLWWKLSTWSRDTRNQNGVFVWSMSPIISSIILIQSVKSVSHSTVISILSAILMNQLKEVQLLRIFVRRYQVQVYVHECVLKRGVEYLLTVLRIKPCFLIIFLLTFHWNSQCLIGMYRLYMVLHILQFTNILLL